MYSSSARKCPTASRSVVSTSCTASAGKPDFFGGLLQQGDDRPVGVDRFFAAAQDHGVAALDADRRRVGRDVRPRFVDEEHHAQRHADLEHFQAVGPNRRFDHFADRLGQAPRLLPARRPSTRSRRASAAGDRSGPSMRPNRGAAARSRALASASTSLLAAQQLGRPPQPGVFLSAAQRGQLAAARRRTLGRFQAVLAQVDGFGDGHGGHLLREVLTAADSRPSTARRRATLASIPQSSERSQRRYLQAATV